MSILTRELFSPCGLEYIQWVKISEKKTYFRPKTNLNNILTIIITWVFPPNFIFSSLTYDGIQRWMYIVKINVNLQRMSVLELQQGRNKKQFQIVGSKRTAMPKLQDQGGFCSIIKYKPIICIQSWCCKIV